MRLSTSLSFALLLLCPFAQAREKKEPNPDLANIHKVFIKGNTEAATVARNRNILPLGPGGWEEMPASVRRFTCFGLVRKEGSADATLEISQDTAPDGMVTVQEPSRIASVTSCGATQSTTYARLARQSHCLLAESRG